MAKPGHLPGRWVHAHEQDTDSERVYVRAGAPLPPSRGRTTLELRPDGTYVQTAPGPVDVPEAAAGVWSLDGDELVLRDDRARVPRTLRITAATADRLAVRR